MHIWCKTEKLLDMYLYLVSEWPHTGQDPVSGEVTRRAHTASQRWSPDMVSVTFSIRGPPGPSGMKNIFLDDRD